jgi:D-xylose transport system substrate-binding protein
MKLFVRWDRLHSLLPGFLILPILLLTSCTSISMGMTNNNSNLPSGAGGKGCTKVGVLLPEITSSTRWETKDHPLLVQAVKTAIPGVQIDYNNAHDSSATQLTQAEADLANGDCILVVSPHDSVAAASIVAKAKAQNVPVIAYDRLIQSKDLNYYVSFDNIKVGQLQGQYIADHYQEYQKAGTGTSNIVVISGSQTDTNALLFSMGVHSILDPLFANSTLKNVAETFTPDWNNSTAQAEMEADLAEQQNNIQIAYVANDGMAGGVITALQTAKLNGKILVTGQDATAEGVHSILTGDQSMTVYKPIAKEAQSVGDLVKALNNGSDINTLTNGVTTSTFDGGNIPSILDTPITVDRTNIASTVIADQYLTKADICNGIPAGTDGVC